MGERKKMFKAQRWVRESPQRFPQIGQMICSGYMEIIKPTSEPIVADRPLSFEQ